MKRVATRRCLVTAPSILLAGVLAGCGMLAGEPMEEVQTPQVQPLVEPRPQLAAARDGQISLFGELPQRPDVPYFSRSATALLQHT